MAWLDFAQSVLDVEDGKYKPELHLISSKQEDIKEKRIAILKLVDEAGELIRAIINDKKMSRQKELEFDNVVRGAEVAIRACERDLAVIKEKTEKLSNNMETIKWSSRFLRVAGAMIFAYVYKQYDDGFIMGIPRYVLAMGVVGVALLSLIPHRVYKSRESLSLMESEHLSLATQLDNLRDELSSAKNFKDGLNEKTY